MGSKFDIEFTGSNDFGLWKVKMKTVLIHNKCVEGRSTNVGESLCLGDKVLREVAKETNTAAMWTKLDSLYMTKSMA
ncbi:cytochrome P450, partial [Trifolium medium]|nr:cytochrome P450 [Trifolium medium]